MWAQMAKTIREKLADGAGDKADWLETKLTFGTFFMERTMPETAAHLARISTGSDTMMSVSADAF
jgi:hypothetical protein